MYGLESDNLVSKNNLIDIIIEATKLSDPKQNLNVNKIFYDILKLSSIIELLNLLYLNKNTIQEESDLHQFETNYGIKTLVDYALKILRFTNNELLDIVYGPVKYHIPLIFAIEHRNNYQPHDNNSSLENDIYFLHEIARRIYEGDYSNTSSEFISKCLDFLSSAQVVILIKNHPEFLYQRDQHGRLICQYINSEKYPDLYKLFRPQWQPNIYSVLTQPIKDKIVIIFSLQLSPPSCWYILPQELIFIIIDYMVEYSSDYVVQSIYNKLRLGHLLGKLII